MPADPQDVQQWGTGLGAFISGFLGSRAWRWFRREGKDPMTCVVDAIREDGAATREVLREIGKSTSELHTDIKVLLDRVPR